jgi:hypothetical protein
MTNTKFFSTTIFAFILTSINLFSQNTVFPFNDSKDKIEYTEIVESSLSPNDLSLKAEMVLQRLLSGSKDKFITSSNKNYGVSGTKHGNITVKSTGLLTSCGAKEYNYRYNISILFKEGKWRYSISEIKLYFETDASYSGTTSYFYGVGISGGRIQSGEEISMNLESVINNIKKCESVWNKLFETLNYKINLDINFLKDEIKKNDGW